MGLRRGSEGMVLRGIGRRERSGRKGRLSVGKGAAVRKSTAGRETPDGKRTIETGLLVDKGPG